MPPVCVPSHSLTDEYCFPASPVCSLEKVVENIQAHLPPFPPFVWRRGRKPVLLPFSLDLSREKVGLNARGVNQVPEDSMFWPSTGTASSLKGMFLMGRVYGGPQGRPDSRNSRKNQYGRHPQEGQHHTSCLLCTWSGLGHLSLLAHHAESQQLLSLGSCKQPTCGLQSAVLLRIVLWVKVPSTLGNCCA